MINKDIFKVYKNVFDQKAIEAIWWLMTHKKIEGLESPIKIGKESNIFSALTKSNERVAVKIFRVNSGSFFKMSKYLAMDTRFRKVGSNRGTITTWARREFLNLKKAYEAGVKVPKPIGLRENVIIMGFIGSQLPEQPHAAPLLKDDCDEPEVMYKKLIESVKLLYSSKIIHGDLSEFNILNDNGEPILIDLSHGTPTNSNAAQDMLERDVKNICRFFNKKGLNLSLVEVIKEIKNQKA